MDNGNEKIKNKKLNIALAITAAALLAFAVVAVIFGLKLPRKERNVLGEDDNYTAQAAYSESELLFSTTKYLILTDKDGNELKRTDVIEETEKSFGINAGKIVGLYKEKGGEYIYVATLNASASERFIVKLSENLEVADCAPYEGLYGGMKETENYLFLFSASASFYTVTRYDKENLTEKTVKGHLYEGFTEGNSTELTVARSRKLLSVDYAEGYLYVVTDGGIIRSDENLSGCRFMAEYDERYKTLKEEYPEKTDAELKSEAEEHVRSVFGLVSFSSQQGRAVMRASDYDAEKYLFVAPEVSAYSGGLYYAKNDKFYLLSSEGEFYSALLEDFFATDLGDVLPIEKIGGVKLKGLPFSQGKAAFYDAYSEKAFVIYETLSEVTAINLAEEKTEYDITLDFDITSVIGVAGNISYTYYNSNLADAGVMIRAIANVDGNLHGKTYKTVFIVSVVLAVIAAAATVILLLSAKSAAFANKTAKLVKDAAKSKLVYLALLPSFVLLCLFCFYPAIASIGLSFFDYTQDRPMLLWNNFKHYINIFASDFAGEAFSNMGIFLVSDLLFALVPPLLFAFFLTVMASKKYSAITRTLLFIPGIIPSVTGLLIWKEGIYGFSGVINIFVKAFNGEPLTLLSDAATAKWAIIMMGFPFVGSYLIFYGAMMNIPSSYYEAAELEGCGVWKRFFRIDLPLIAPQIKYVIICTFIASLQNFSRTYMIDKSASYGTKTPIHIMYTLMLSGDYGYSAAYATVIFVLLLFATIINMKMQFKKSED